MKVLCELLPYFTNKGFSRGRGSIKRMEQPIGSVRGGGGLSFQQLKGLLETLNTSTIISLCDIISIQTVL